MHTVIALQDVYTRAPKEERVTAWLTAPPHTHTHTYPEMSDNSTQAIRHTHMGRNPKLLGGTLTHAHKSSVTGPVQNREEEGACISDRSGSPGSFHNRVLVQGTPLLIIAASCRQETYESA